MEGVGIWDAEAGTSAYLTEHPEEDQGSLELLKPIGRPSYAMGSLLPGFFWVPAGGKVHGSGWCKLRPLSVPDVATDNSGKPGVIRIRVKQSKTDPFRKGMDLYIGRIENDLCPVAAPLQYMGTREAPCSCFRMAGFSPGSVLWTV